jgi:hypothetical protein
MEQTDRSAANDSEQLESLFQAFLNEVPSTKAARSLPASKSTRSQQPGLMNSSGA